MMCHARQKKQDVTCAEKPSMKHRTWFWETGLVEVPCVGVSWRQKQEKVTWCLDEGMDQVMQHVLLPEILIWKAS